MCAPSIRSMHWSQDLHEQIMEANLRTAIQRERLNELYGQLVALDPEGGEPWFADDNNVHPTDFARAIQQVENRIEWLIGT